MPPFSQVLGGILVFLPSVYALTQFKKASTFSQKIVFLFLSLAIFVGKGVVPFLIFLATFVPLISLDVSMNPVDEPKNNPTTIQEKFFVYLSLMPLFGLLILKKDIFEKNINEINLPSSQIWIFEVVLIVLIFLTLIGTYRLKRK